MQAVVVEDAFADAAVMHFFQAEGLGAELDAVGLQALLPPVFVFNGGDAELPAAAAAVFDGV